MAAPRSDRATRASAFARLTRSSYFWVTLAAGLLFLVINPLFRLVQISLRDADAGAFTLLNHVAAWSRERHLIALWNSIRLGMAVTCLCLIFEHLAALGFCC